VSGTMTSRRSALRRGAFLSQLGAGITAVACGTVPGFAASKPSLPATTVRQGDSLYDVARLDMNGRLDFHPYAIAYCAGPAEASRAVRWAAINGRTIALRGGGHDYEGFSLNDGGLVIDLRRYAGMTLTHGGARARIGAGTPIGMMYDELAKSHSTLPAGTCPSVGITGLTTGGGYGLLVRRYGLLCDRLRRVSLIDAEGRVRDTATDHMGDDILWACKGGGGGSFGVVTDLEFDVLPSPKTVTYFSLRWAWDETTAASVIERWMSWGADAPRALTSILTLQGGWAKSIHVFGLMLADARALTPLIDPLAHGTKPKERVVRPMSYADALALLRGPLPNRQSWKKKSSFGAHPLNGDGIAAVVKHVESSPPSVACILEFDTVGGAVGDVAAHATAYPHRGMTYLLQYQTEWKGDAHADAALAWVRSAFDAIDPHTAMKSYRNYSDLDLQDWQRRYFDGNYARLQAIKSRLDPDDRFRYPQSIKGVTR